MSPDEEKTPPTMDICSATFKRRQITNADRTDDVQKDDVQKDDVQKDDESTAKVVYVPRIKWPDLGAQIFIHVGFLYGLYLVLTQAKLLTTLWVFVTIYTSGFGITAGVHRLWSHKAYKAKWPLRLLLVFLFTITGQKDVYTWALDHRVHHKCSETDADPHDVRRGFFYAHVGWLFMTPHPDVVAKRKAIDMSDLEADSIVMWQKRLYIPLFALLTIGLPVAVPCYFWSESLWISFWVNFNFRFCINLNIAFCVNSVAHMWGQKPASRCSVCHPTSARVSSFSFFLAHFSLLVALTLTFPTHDVRGVTELSPNCHRTINSMMTFRPLSHNFIDRQSDTQKRNNNRFD